MDVMPRFFKSTWEKWHTLSTREWQAVAVLFFSIKNYILIYVIIHISISLFRFILHMHETVHAEKACNQRVTRCENAVVHEFNILYIKYVCLSHGSQCSIQFKSALQGSFKIMPPSFMSQYLTPKSLTFWEAQKKAMTETPDFYTYNLWLFLCFFFFCIFIPVGIKSKGRGVPI